MTRALPRQSSARPSRRGRLGGFVLAVCLSVARLAAAADADTTVLPSAGSDQVLKLRAAPQGELRLTYRHEIDGRPAAAVSVGLASDYDVMDDGSSLTIHDYRLRRILIRRPDRRLVNTSLFADVWLRIAVLENQVRAMRSEAQAASASGAAPPGTLVPFWIESEMSMRHQALTPPNLRREANGATIVWRLDGQEVATVRFNGGAVPDEVRPGLRRLLATMMKLHPLIADDIAARGQMPEDISFKVLLPGRPGVGSSHWSLMKTEWVTAARYPLPPGLKPVAADDQGAFPEIFSILADDVALGRRPPPASTYVTRVRTAEARHAGLEALVWTTEMVLAAGPVPPSCAPQDPNSVCALQREARPLAKDDPRTAVAFGPEAPNAADRHKLDDLPNAYLLDVLFVARPRPRGDDPAVDERALLAGIKRVPIADFSKDIGDFYLLQRRAAAAWQAWDLGRAMAGHRPGDLLDQVDNLESRLVLAQPSFF
jgi:hypothetical protein